MENFTVQLLEISKVYLPKIVLAIILIIAGIWLIKAVVKIIENIMEKKEVDTSLGKFLSKLISITLNVALIISIASTIGIETTSFVAVLGAAGLAIGLALQGSLSNFAGGVLILLNKPFKVGDFIEGGGQMGTVDNISIFYTVLKTPQNQVISIPNGGLANSSVVNYSTESTRRLDETWGIGYGDDIDKAKAVLKDIIENDERVIKENGYQIIVTELADSSVNLQTRVWATGADFWNLKFDMLETVKKRFDAEGISIPFPQWDVHLFDKNAN